MCGICGFNFSDDLLLARMMKTIYHRGPDQYGRYSDSAISLGHRRLSIVDLSKNARQPMSDEEGKVWIVFNGEIYNFKSLKSSLKKRHEFVSNSDTEVIIHLYQEIGEKVFEMLEGDFAIALYDSSKKMLFLARDHIGVKPLYYHFSGGKFIFCSEIKGILEASFVKRVINKKAFNCFMTLRHNVFEETMFEGVKRVLPGHIIRLDLQKKSASARQFWSLDISSKHIEDDKDEKYFVEKYRQLLFSSVNDRLMGDVPLGVYLSGGIDSSSIVAAMRHNNKDMRINTFSVGFSNDRKDDELNFAKKVSEHLGTDHKEFIITPDAKDSLKRITWLCDEPIADPAMIPVLLLSKQAKKKSTVILTGDGGDEIFAGYEQYKFMSLLHKIRHVRPLAAAVAPAGLAMTPDFVLNKIFKYASSLGPKGKERAAKMLSAKTDFGRFEEFYSLFDEDEKKEVLADKSYIDPGMASYFNKKYFPAEDKAGQHKLKDEYLNRLLRMDIKTILPEGYLMKTDRMCLGYAIEGRVPLLDKRLVDFSFTLPTNYKLRGSTEKYIMKQGMRGFLPKEIIKRKKQRFYVPIDLWLRKDLKPFVGELLDEKRIREQGIFEPDYIKRITEKYNEGRLFYARQLWNMMTFQLWHETFMEGKTKEWK